MGQLKTNPIPTQEPRNEMGSEKAYLSISLSDLEYIPSESNPPSPRETLECQHLETIKLGSEKVCKDCGFVMHFLDYSFSENDSGTRCKYARGLNTRTIDDVFLRNGVTISGMLMDSSEQKYKTIVEKEKVRGKDRDALVAVCMLFCMRNLGDRLTVDDIRRIFGVTHKKISCSLAKYYRHFPAERTKYLYPEDLVKRTLEMQSVDLKYTEPIQKLCVLVKGKSKLLSRSTPQSTATALTFLYLKNRKEIPSTVKDKKQFAKKAHTSEITIDKILTEVCRLFGVKDETTRKRRNCLKDF